MMNILEFCWRLTFRWAVCCFQNRVFPYILKKINFFFFKITWPMFWSYCRFPAPLHPLPVPSLSTTSIWICRSSCTRPNRWEKTAFWLARSLWHPHRGWHFAFVSWLSQAPLHDWLTTYKSISIYSPTFIFLPFVLIYVDTETFSFSSL